MARRTNSVGKRWVRALLVTMVGSLVACSGGSSDQAPVQPSVTAPGDGSVAAAEIGQNLSAPAADSLEKALQATPNDLNAREQLVGYYFMRSELTPTNPDALSGPNTPTAQRDRHLVWLIQHHPGLELLGAKPIGVVQPRPDAVGYAAAKLAWSNQLAAPATPQVKGNAGIFFDQTDDSQAEGLLAAAEAGDSQNASWPDALAGLFLRRAKSATPGSPAAQHAATFALRELENAWSLNGGSNRDPRLSTLAKLAVVAGEDDKATHYATILLETFKADPSQSTLTIGGPLHDGNMVLGEVALHRGDRSKAEQLLLKAGNTPGSPQLDQFGPNFLLARDLLVAGSKDVVLRYCDEVAKFWGDPRLQAWRDEIAAGKTPDFGDNLWN
jgi:hypothetical protein